MKYIVNIRGDINDADYTEKSLVLDFNVNPFKGWGGEISKSNITWKHILEALGNSISDYENIKNKIGRHYCNWDKDAQDFIFKSVVEKLKDVVSLSADDIQEVTQDLFPGSYNYPIHTILSISAVPQTNRITFY